MAAEIHEPSLQPTSRRWYAVAGLAFLSLMVFGIYQRTLSYEMIFDDLPAIVDNESIHQLFPLFGAAGESGPLKPKPVTPVTARPLVSLTFALNYHLGQADPWGYRLSHLLAHLLVALLLWRVVAATLNQPTVDARWRQRREWLGFWAACIWMVHPVNTETVVYLTQRTELQMGLFYILTIYLCLAFWRSTRLLSRIFLAFAALIASSCGMLSKEMMASVPAVVFLYEWTFLGGSLVCILKRSWMLYGGMMLSWVPLALIYASGNQTPLGGFNNTISGPDFWLTQSNSFFVYWRMLFFPWPLLLHYHVPTLTTLAEAWPGVIGMTLYTIVALIAVYRRTVLGFALIAFFAVLSPTLIVPLPHEEICERRMYVPMMAVIPGLVVAIYALWSRAGEAVSGWALSRRISDPPRQGLGTLLMHSLPLPTITVIFAAVCISTLPRLSDRSEIWTYVLRHQPHNLYALASQGQEDCAQGKVDLGLDRMYHAFQCDPDYAYFTKSLLVALNHFQRFDRLVQVTRQIYESEPKNVTKVHAYAVSLEKSGQPQEAIRMYRAAIKLAPDAWESHSALGTLLIESGYIVEALPHVEASARLHPDYMNCMNLVTVHLHLEQYEDALRAGKMLLAAARKERTPEEVRTAELFVVHLEKGLRHQASGG